MNDTRIIQAKALVADAQKTIDDLVAELAPSEDRRELMHANDTLTAAWNVLQRLSLCKNPHEGIQCGLPDGHYGQHQRSFNGGRHQWTNHAEPVNR